MNDKFNHDQQGRGTLIILCGLPGSGKTTLAKRIVEQSTATRLCPDDWMAELNVDVFDEEFRSRLEQLQWRLGQQLLRSGNTVVIEWGTWARSERDVLREGARKLGARAELYLLDAPGDVLWDRIVDRGFEAQYGSRALTKSEVDKWREVFQRPDAEEFALFDKPTLSHLVAGS